MTNVYIVAAKRTAFGAFGGKLAGLTATELGGIASAAAAKNLPSGTPIDSIIYGNVLQTSRDAAFLARHIGHRSGLVCEELIRYRQSTHPRLQLTDFAGLAFSP